MLIEFTLGNYRSFKNKVTLSMAASASSENTKKDLQSNRFIAYNKLSLLKTAAIYGANASGKSNILKGLSVMKDLVLNSSKEKQTLEPIEEYDPFKLEVGSEKQPMYFEVIFIHDNKRFRYGFEVNQQQIISEWLYYVKDINSKIVETELFIRTAVEFKIHPRVKKRLTYKASTKPNSLYLSVCAQFNEPIMKLIVEWFYKLNIVFLFDFNQTSYLNQSVERMKEDENFKSNVLELIKDFDLFIQDFDIKTQEISQGLESRRIIALKHNIRTFHTKFDKNGNEDSSQPFDLDTSESEGTKKLFSFAGAIISSIQNGGILVVDELESKLHPLISMEIVKLFNSDKNSKGSQLIFVTHSTTLLDKNILRRDQIWFTEKNRFGAGDLYSLIEYKDNRPIWNSLFDKDYLGGKYGALPVIGSLNNLV